MNHDLQRRRILLAMLGSGIGLAGVLRLAAAQDLLPKTQGLHRTTGEVRVNGAPAVAGNLVRPGDTVTTGRNAMAMFVVGSDAYLMRADSRAELAGRDTFVNLLRLVSGGLLGVFGRGGPRRIETPAATIGIRGTGAYLEAEAQRSYFCLCYGAAEIATADGGARDAYSTRHHESPRYIYGDRRDQPIVPANVANHNDAELIMLETLVGRTPPREFMNSTYRY